MIPLAARAFLPPSVSSCLDRVSLPILEDDCWSTLSFWKISLPLKPIVLSPNGNASGSYNFVLWKWDYKSGNFSAESSGQIHDTHRINSLALREVQADAKLGQIKYFLRLLPLL
jgi:hypothetical protein